LKQKLNKENSKRIGDNFKNFSQSQLTTSYTSIDTGINFTIQKKETRNYNPYQKIKSNNFSTQLKSYPAPNTNINFTIQKKENKTGLPNNLKSGIENLSGIDMSDVKVHYNSSQPAQLNAHAYAQGNQIHIAPGQEKHLPHEAWHVVQQKQGRVKPTKQLKGKVSINDDEGLEKEADVMGAKASLLSVHNNSAQFMRTTSANRTFQRVIIQGADANERGAFASAGIARLISNSEIENTNKYLREEGRHYEKKTFSIDDLHGITFDPVNYLNGHYQAGEGYLGLTAVLLAQRLQEAGLVSGQNIILTGCDSAGYAAELVVELHRLGVTIKVTGARGIAFDYKAANGIVEEAMFDSSRIPAEVNEEHNAANKLAIANKYEEIFINEVTSTIFDVGVIAEQEEFFNYFARLGKTNIKFLQNTQLSPARIQELTDASDVFQGLIGAAGDVNAVIPANPSLDVLVQYSQNGSRPAFSKKQLIDFKTRLSAEIPSIKNVGDSADNLRAQAGNGRFIFKKYKSRDQLWISTFMGEVNRAPVSAVTNFIKKKYLETGREAANEYIKTMVAGYKADAPTAVIDNGWVTFTPGGEPTTHGTYRAAADAAIANA
jgi:hypothetical protein